jgi:hypothetical protein
MFEFIDKSEHSHEGCDKMRQNFTYRRMQNFCLYTSYIENFVAKCRKEHRIRSGQ